MAFFWGGGVKTGGGGSTSRTGTGSTQASSNGAQNVHRQGGNQPTIWSYTALIETANTPQSIHPVVVPPGCTVRLRANNGAATGNSGVVFVADRPSAFALGQGSPLAPLDDVAWPVNKLVKIWIYGAKGDGVVVSIINVMGANS